MLLCDWVSHIFVKCEDQIHSSKNKDMMGMNGFDILVKNLGFMILMGMATVWLYSHVKLEPKQDCTNEIP